VIEVRVPDIGRLQGRAVIEVLVKPGDRVEKEQPLVTLESDKATMDVPSPSAGHGRAAAGEGRRQDLGRVGDLTLEAAEQVGPPRLRPSPNRPAQPQAAQPAATREERETAKLPLSAACRRGRL